MEIRDEFLILDDTYFRVYVIKDQEGALRAWLSDGRQAYMSEKLFPLDSVSNEQKFYRGVVEIKGVKYFVDMDIEDPNSITKVTESIVGTIERYNQGNWRYEDDGLLDGFFDFSFGGFGDFGGSVGDGGEGYYPDYGGGGYSGGGTLGGTP